MDNKNLNLMSQQNPERPKLNLQNDMTFFVEKNGGIKLLRNGRQLKCPFRMPLQIDTVQKESEIKSGFFDKAPKVSTRIDERGCGDWCPHFSFESGKVKEAGKTVDFLNAVITCSGQKRIHPISNVATPAPEEKAPLTIEK